MCPQIAARAREGKIIAAGWRSDPAIAINNKPGTIMQRIGGYYYVV
jgi:hypothetical protein